MSANGEKKYEEPNTQPVHRPESDFRESTARAIVQAVDQMEHDVGKEMLVQRKWNEGSYLFQTGHTEDFLKLDKERTQADTAEKLGALTPANSFLHTLDNGRQALEINLIKLLDDPSLINNYPLLRELFHNIWEEARQDSISTLIDLESSSITPSPEPDNISAKIKRLIEKASPHYRRNAESIYSFMNDERFKPIQDKMTPTISGPAIEGIKRLNKVSLQKLPPLKK